MGFPKVNYQILQNDVSNKPPTQIENLFIGAGSDKTPFAIIANTQQNIYPGALTSGVYLSVLNITGGSGILKSLAISTLDATARQIGCRLTIDGLIIFDDVSSTITVSGAGMVIAGSLIETGLLSTDRIPFLKSMDVAIKSNITETNKMKALIEYELK